MKRVDSKSDADSDPKLQIQKLQERQSEMKVEGGGHRRRRSPTPASGHCTYNRIQKSINKIVMNNIVYMIICFKFLAKVTNC